MEAIYQAAKYYLGYQGLPTTRKRIEKLMSQMSDESILRLARDRGYNS